MVAATACSFDWDTFDPRLGAVSSAAGTGAAGAGGGSSTGAMGGMSTSSSASGGMGGMAPLGPFGMPQIVAELSTVDDEDDPTLTEDGLEIIFNSDRSGGDPDFFSATRATVNDPWTNITELVVLNSAMNDSNGSIAPDGLSIWFFSNRTGTPEIYASTRSTRTSAWAAPMPVAELNMLEVDEFGGISGDSLMATVSSKRLDPMAPADLYVTTRANKTSPWNTPVPIVELNSPEEEGESWLSPDALTIYFMSRRDDPTGTIYWSSRMSTSDTWSTPLEVAELTTMDYDSDAHLLPDLHTIFFSRSVVTGEPREIFMATR
jgi:hypothetical protein